MSAKEKNPFRPGNGIVPPFVAGREQVLESFSSLLDENSRGLPRNLILYGLRGTGKTVMLQLFRTVCEEKGWLFAEREFNERFRDEEFFAEAFLKDVTNLASQVSLRKRLKEMGKKVGDTIKPEEVEVLGVKYKPFYKSEHVLLEDHLKDSLVDNWKVIDESSSKNKGLVFLYDEFHSVRDCAPNFPLASLLGAMAYAQRKGCKYILVIAGLPNIRGYLKEAKTYVERMFAFSELGNLPKVDARRAIEEPLSASGIKFDDDVLEAIANETRGYPYFLQFYCYYLVEKLDKFSITLSDYRAVHEEILSQLDRSFFEDRFDQASDAEQQILLSMAKAGEEDVKTSEICKRVKQDYQTAIVTLNRLLDKNFIYKTRKGRYSFALPLFRDFLLRKLSRT